jgi:CubicO group peptidase (beta-lactamase class C family)
MATTIAVMKLYDQGKLNIYGTLGTYLPSVRGTDKESLLLSDILAHQAGLVAWIPFYKETLDSTKHPMDSLYKTMPGGRYTIKVADKLYLRNDWRDSIWQRILRSPLETKGRYVYSDLDFMLLQKVVEQVSGKGIDQFLNTEFYKPLGLQQTAFNAKRNLPKAQVAPSENDTYFRYQSIQGYVHDMGAAMLGGVSGHAGLFSSANDVAIVYQMLLNGGIYKGKRYLKKSTIDLFTTKQSGISRRGLGFDKPDLPGRSSPCTDQASLKTYGHQGFTGTCVWADPEHDLVFVFLSNRTYPSAENKKINSMNVREKAQSYIYQSMGIVPRR